MLKIILNTVLGVVLIFIWLRFVNIKEVFSTISKVDLVSLLPIFLFMLASPVLRAVRLQIFLAEIKKIPLGNLIFLNGVAQMLNFFIPIRAGEIAKGIYLNTKYNLPLGKSVVWIFLDRFVDFLVVFLVVAIMVLFIPTKLPANFTKIVTLIGFVSLIVAYSAVFQQSFAKKIVKFLIYLLIEKHIKIYFERFSNFILDSFIILKRHPKDLFLLGIFTVLAYAADAAIWYFTFISLGVNQDFLKMYLGQLLSALTYLIPAAPGYVGSAEASGLLILSGVFGIKPNLSSAMIVLFHILSAVFVLVFGLISVLSLKLDLGLILRKAFKQID